MTDITEHWRKLYQNNYLGAWDLFVNGSYRTATASIEGVRYEEIVGEGGRKEKKLLLDLVGKSGRKLPAPMIVTKTSGKTLQAMFGERPEGWRGQTISLYAKQRRTKEGQAWVLTIRNARANQELVEQLEERAQVDTSELDDPDRGP